MGTSRCCRKDYEKEKKGREECGEKFEGVMWHGGYDQSITSSATRGPTHSINITGAITFRSLHLCRSKESEEKER